MISANNKETRSQAQYKENSQDSNDNWQERYIPKHFEHH